MARGPRRSARTTTQKWRSRPSGVAWRLLSQIRTRESGFEASDNDVAERLRQTCSVRSSLDLPGRRLPELAPELAAIAEGVERGDPATIHRARRVAERAIRELCTDE